ncbi:MAG: T9SS type A sorting domain-containing protein [Bacteroidetes bacterium]|nr:T9SS type A sorting domain-containing protein [Bacteroidota bacterium]
MKKLLTIILALFVFTTISQAQVYSTTTGGNWSTATTWSGGVVPSATDSVIIQGPVKLYLGVPTIHHLQITEAGSLLDGWVCTLTVTGNVWMNGVVNCTAGSNFEFNIGGDLHLNGNWLGDLTFTGTNDHYLSTASDITFDPYNHILALESKIIAASDIYITSPSSTNFIVKEIDLSGGYSMYLKNTRIGGYSYFINDGVRPKIIGAGNSITFSGTQQYYEFCDLHDVTLYGSSRMSSGVGFYGEVINEDTLTVGIVPQTINVYGNFTNNDFIGLFTGGWAYTSFNFYQNFTNNGACQTGDVYFIGTNDHILKTLNGNYIEAVHSSIYALEGKIIAGSNLYLRGYSLNTVDIDLSSGFDLYLYGLYVGDTNFKTKISANNQNIYSVGGQTLLNNCEIYNAKLNGHTRIFSNNIQFYGETINIDTLTSSYEKVANIYGNFTNNGAVGGYYGVDIPSFNFHQNFTNGGPCNIRTATITGDVDNYILMRNDVPITGNVVLDAILTGTNFQWQKDGVSIAGANSQTFTFNSGLSSTNYGEYKCVVDGNTSRNIFIGNELPNAFEITDVIIKTIDSNSTLVIWKTTVPAAGFIFHAENDPSSGYPLETAEPYTQRTEHSLLLENLNYGSTYYFIIDQMDQDDNNVRSGEFSFIAGDFTLGALTINSIIDVPEDQGGWVYVNFDADIWDAAGEIKLYGVWEWMNEEWVSVGSVPAIQNEKYTFLAHTYADSNNSGMFWSKFYISAHSTNPLVFFNSKVDSGYSIDNLAPAVPTGLKAIASSVSVNLHWDRNTDSDFAYFKIYRNDQFYANTIDTNYTDGSVLDMEYNYKISAVDNNGNESKLSEPIIVVVGVEDETNVPTEFSLGQNYPNPFNPLTKIEFAIPEESHVSLKVYDALGKLVRTLVDGKLSIGFHSVDFEASGLPSGVYIYRVVFGNTIESKKMMVLK